MLYYLKGRFCSAPCLICKCISTTVRLPSQSFLFSPLYDVCDLQLHSGTKCNILYARQLCLLLQGSAVVNNCAYLLLLHPWLKNLRITIFVNIRRMLTSGLANAFPQRKIGLCNEVNTTLFLLTKMSKEFELGCWGNSRWVNNAVPWGTAGTSLTLISCYKLQSDWKF